MIYAALFVIAKMDNFIVHWLAKDEVKQFSNEIIYSLKKDGFIC